VNCRDIAELAPLHLTGELEALEAADFSAHLEGCPSCAEEMERQAYFDARLREIVLADDTNVTSIDRRVRLQIAADSRSGIRVTRSPMIARRWTAAAIGIAAALLLFGFGYHNLFGRHLAAVYAAAATDHRLEVVEMQPRPWSSGSAQIEALGAGHGIPAPAISALASGSYHLDRAKVCMLDGRVFLHLVFSDGAQEFSVYLRQRDSSSLPGQVRETANGKSLHTSDLNHEYVASFETAQLTFVVVTNQSGDAALHFARFASSVL
jgi:hypothetical protein